jgi:ribosomal protein S18 acetylase RimI-like enzyme
VRAWPYEPDVAQLVFFARGNAPSRSQLQHWLHELVKLGYTSVRTGALGDEASDLVESLGFDCVQRLALLEHTGIPAASRPRGHRGHPTHRLTADQHDSAAIVDRSAFEAPWALDADTIADVRTATPRHRARGVSVDGALVAYAISGRDGRLGFVQRLSVDAPHQHQGYGRALVVDAMRWFARWRVDQVLVNTHEHNEAALRLYRGLGFVDLPRSLRVYERELE